MGILFNASEEADKASRVRRERAEVRRRAEEADAALQEFKELDARSAELGKTLAQAQAAVEAITYESYRRPGSRWMIEHAKVGNDYVYQLFPLRPISIAWQDVIALMIVAMDVIFPRSIEIHYAPPNETYQLKFYTIRVHGVVGKPGWTQACRERALLGLSCVEAWPS